MTAQLRYPLEIGDATDYVMFTPQKYRANNAAVAARNDQIAGPPTNTSAASVILYMPKSTPLIGNNQAWGPMNFMGPIGDIDKLIGAGGVNTVLAQKDLDITKTIDNIRTEFQELKGGAQGVAALRQAGMNFIPSIQNPASPSQLMAMAQGKVYNPNTELLYSNPGLREFNFGFNFVPKSRAEAQIVNKIILNFKKWSAPKALDQGMLEVPHIWNISYMTNGKPNPNMNKFKKAACMGVTVQANPQTSSHVTFEDGMPIETVMGLNFKEVDIVTRKDHEDAQGQGF